MGTSEEEPFKDINVHLKVNQQQLHETLEEEFSQLSGLAMPARLSPMRRPRIHASSRDVQIFARNTPGTQAVLQELRRRGFQRIRLREDRARKRTGIFYGQAATVLMEALFAEQFSEEIPAEKILGSHDDVHIWLPESISGSAALARRSSSPPNATMDLWVYGAEKKAAERPFLVRIVGALLVDTSLQREGSVRGGGRMDWSRKP